LATLADSGLPSTLLKRPVRSVLLICLAVNALFSSPAKSASATTGHHLGEAQASRFANAQARRSKLDLSRYHPREPVFKNKVGLAYWEVWYASDTLNDRYIVQVDDHTGKTKLLRCTGG
jgi:hypothetical protein